jgi:uncharacterized alkaline shock family protein YloU
MTEQQTENKVTDNNSLAQNNNIAGNIKIDHQVLANIAGKSTLNIPGVISLKPNLIERIRCLFTNSSERNGIKVYTNKSDIFFTIKVVLDYNLRIPDIVWQIQNNISKQVESVTGKTVTKVDVIVYGLNKKRDQ